MIGADGNDYICGDDGDDVLYGAGTECDYYVYTGYDIVHGGDGNDSLYGGFGYQESDGEYYGDDGCDVIEIEVGAGYFTISGGDDADVIKVGLQDSWAGFDIYGDEGDDLIISHGSSDSYINGGEGDDTILASSGQYVIDGDDGCDVIDLANCSTGEIDGGRGDDIITVDADSSYATVYGGCGDDLIKACGGCDANDQWFDGGEGSDTIFGSGGDDALYGSEGDDVLIGGDGDDYLEGGGCSMDAFTFQNSDYSGRASECFTDIIADFELGLDKIVFDGLGIGYNDLSICDTWDGAEITYRDCNGNENAIIVLDVEACDLWPSEFIFV